MWALLAEWRWASFNPTLVRLRPAQAKSGTHRRLRFQSHAGSIEAGVPGAAHPPRAARFQSHAGSIEAWWCEGVWERISDVSIPRWFD